MDARRYNPCKQSKGLLLAVLIYFLCPRVSLESKRMNC